MAEIEIIRRRHYSGLDADKANVTGVKGESYSATDSGKKYYWNTSLSAWKTGLGFEYVVRSPGAADLAGGNPTGAGVDFTTDGNWKVDGLDISGIVPVNAVAVVLGVAVGDDAAGSGFHIRKSAATPFNKIWTTTHVANINEMNAEIINVDSNRLLDYWGTNVTFTLLEVTVLGWFI